MNLYVAKYFVGISLIFDLCKYCPISHIRLISPICINTTLHFQNASKKRFKRTEFFASNVKACSWLAYRKLSGKGKVSGFHFDENLSVLTITAVSVQIVLIQSLLNLALINTRWGCPPFLLGSTYEYEK